MRAIATREELRLWLEYGIERKAAYLIIVRDMFDWVDFPVYVADGESVEAKCREYSGSWAQVEEVFNLKMNVESQLKEKYPDPVAV